jgi:urocanate hydratase
LGLNPQFAHAVLEILTHDPQGFSRPGDIALVAAQHIFYNLSLCILDDLVQVVLRRCVLECKVCFLLFEFVTDKTDHAAMECIDPNRRGQDRDNYIWIRDAEQNKLVVGSQARILYQDAEGRMRIALKFNEMVRCGEIGPVMLGRDHHDVSGTDSPFRETANIKDGSNVMADMATHCFAGNAARGMSLIALHNGGGVGVGKSINGGFGLLLDGSERVDTIIRSALLWDVMGGVARRSWARNENSITTSMEFNRNYQGKGHITLPYLVEEKLVEKLVEKV